MQLTLQSALAFSILGVQAIMLMIPAGPGGAAMTLIAQTLLSMLQQFSGKTSQAGFMAKPPVALPPQPWTPEVIKEWAEAQAASAP